MPSILDRILGRARPEADPEAEAHRAEVDEQAAQSRAVRQRAIASVEAVCGDDGGRDRRRERPSWEELFGVEPPRKEERR